MGLIADELIASAFDEDPFDYRVDDIWATQVAAVNERFDRAKDLIATVAQRADEAGIARVVSRSDLLPFLFSSGTYQSYPDSAVRNKRWDVLAMWMSSYSAIAGLRDVDFAGAESIDDWIGRAGAAGHIVFASGGVRGKSSLYDQTADDVQRLCDLVGESLRWCTGARADRSRHAFLLFPKNSTHNYTAAFRSLAERFGRPDSMHWLSDEPMLVSDTNRVGELRHAIAHGTAKPSEIAALHEQDGMRAARVEQNFDELAAALVAAADEPCMILGTWGMHWRLVQQLRQAGVERLHPDSLIEAGGSTKLTGSYPADYQEQIAQAYGKPLAKFWKSYGMAEIPSQFPRCSALRYHVPPWVVPLIVGDDGELAEPGGTRLPGRMTMVDLAIEGQWGGFASGDLVTLETAPCECGRPSPAVVEIGPLPNLKDADDKLSCAGTVDAYVRGVGAQ